MMNRQSPGDDDDDNDRFKKKPKSNVTNLKKKKKIGIVQVEYTVLFKNCFCLLFSSIAGPIQFRFYCCARTLRMYTETHIITTIKKKRNLKEENKNKIKSKQLQKKKKVKRNETQFFIGIQEIPLVVHQVLMWLFRLFYFNDSDLNQV